MAIATQASAAPSPAVAPPPGNPRFPLFDSLRAIAVLAVLAFHVGSITGDINKRVIGDVLALFGDEGLILFFAISGFLLYRPYAAAHAGDARRPRTTRYARRRVLRIVPAYWTALTLLAIFPGIVGVFTGDWWRYYFFLQVYSTRTVGGGIPPAWTLCVEVSFYAVLPVWAILARWISARVGRGGWLRPEVLLLALAALLGVVIQVLASRLIVSSLLATTLLGESVWFALGMALAVASVATAQRERPCPVVRAVLDHSGLCWLGAAACLAAATAVLHPGGLFNIIVSLRTKQPFPRTLAGLVLSAGMIALLMAPAVFVGERSRDLPRRVLAFAPLAWLGLISYGVYLYHLTVAQLLGEQSDPGHFSASGLGLVSHIHHGTTPILFVLTLAVSAALAALSYYLIELPFLRRKER